LTGQVPSGRAQRRTGDPRTTAVVCVECQRGVLGHDSVLPGLRTDAERILPHIERLVQAARRAGVQVVHATFEGHLGAADPGRAPLWRAMGPRTADWAPGHPATEVLPELLSPDDLVLPRHHGLAPAWGTELLPVLRTLGTRTIVLAGVSLNLALPLTAGEAAHGGFGVVVPRDAVAGTPAEYGELVLTHTMAMLGVVTTVDDLVADWDHALGESVK
jgi:nicotinamidase-related amidase